MQSRCIEIASRAAYSLQLQTVSGFSISTPLHKRAVFANVVNGSVIGLKGCGWTLGPPYAVGSKKDAELWLGLLDEASGIREEKVSAKLQKWGVNCTKIVGIYHLTKADLELLGLFKNPIFTNGNKVNPIILATQYKSRFRIGDCIGREVTEWLNEFDRLNPHNNRNNALEAFGKDLAKSILIYQSYGAVNDTLGPENITLGGEITDFEWIYTPGISLPNGQSDEILRLRQEKEWVYYLESIHALAYNLSVDFSISDCISWVRATEKSIGKVNCGFVDAAYEMAEINDY
jgi:hypothetical protein